jgi:hypothetical protein
MNSGVRMNDATRSLRGEFLAFDLFDPFNPLHLKESYRFRGLSGSEAEAEDAALQKVEEVKNDNVNTTLDMMDRHNEMVKKSQELYKAKARQRAIERQNTKRREEHSELLAEMALRNAQRRDLLESARLAR